MVLLAQRLLPHSKRDAELRLANDPVLSFRLRNRHKEVGVYCSPHNLGAAALAEELNQARPIRVRHAHSREAGLTHRGERLEGCASSNKYQLVAKVREADFA